MITADTEQREQLERVTTRIQSAVLAFCRARVGHEFHMDTLFHFVHSHTGHAAPDSAGRILRLLRQEGLVGYEVVNRRQSLYRVTAVAGADVQTSLAL
jgi:hypothetical protein